MFHAKHRNHGCLILPNKGTRQNNISQQTITMISFWISLKNKTPICQSKNLRCKYKFEKLGKRCVMADTKATPAFKPQTIQITSGNLPYKNYAPT